MAWLRRRGRTGLTGVEVLAVIAVIALLLAMGFMLYRSMRLAARVAVAESNLKQVATGMELYFQKYGSYPPEGSDLVAELGPFVEDPDVFHNPLMEEETLGETINALYRAPTLDELDRPNRYLTAMIADNGTTVVILETGHRVVRREDLCFDPSGPAGDVVAVLDPDGGDADDGGDASDGDGGDDTDGGFDVGDDGDVKTKMCSDVSIQCIGSQFGYADGTLVDIVVEAKLDEDWMSLYGGQPVSGGESYSKDNVPAGTSVIVKGEIAGEYERWLWSYYGYPLSYTSTDGSGQVLTLKKGDTPVCFEPGFPCQAAVGDLLAPYVDPQTKVVAIADNEALYLWDFNPLETEYGIDYQDLIILATAVATDESECEDPADEDPAEEAAGSILAGEININPRNNTDFQFTLVTGDGTVITRSDLLSSNGVGEYYSGPATKIIVCPKGNGNQNGLTVDGQARALDNGTLYTIESDNMTVRLYNARPKRSAGAMGQWWIKIDASGATIVP